MVTIVKPEDWTVGAPIYQYLAVGNTTYGSLSAASGYIYNPDNTWALTSPTAGTLRFEVRSGDTMLWGPDINSDKERSEISANDPVAAGQPMHISYDFTLDPGSPNTAKWLVVGQLLQQPQYGEATLGPPFSIQMSGERMTIWARYEAADGSIVQQKIYTDTVDIVRGETYDMDIYANITASDAGRLVVVRDGQVIADYSGPLGYIAGEPVQWKEGVYRSAAPETIAASYGDLQISSGDAVQIPAKGTTTFVQAAAPDLKLTSTVQDTDGGLVTLTGHGTPGAIVKLFDNDELVGQVKIGANGRYWAKVEVGTGNHILTAATSDASGALSEVSTGVSVQVGTAADILNRMPYIAAMSGLSTIILTDTNILTVASTAQMTDLLTNSQAALDKIVGGYSFLQFSGNADNRKATYYDDHGVATSAVTDVMTNGVLTRETKEYYNMPAGAVQKEVLTYGITGQSYTSQYQAFTASKMVEVVRYHDDGTLAYRSLTPETGDSSIETYNAAGLLTNYTVTHPTGSTYGSEIYTFNVTGQAWTSTYSAYDANGTKVVSTRSFGDGSLQYDYLRNPDGTTVQHTYAADGTLTTMTATTVDGRMITQNYSAGALTMVTTKFANGSTETDNWRDGNVTSTTVTNTSGTVTKETYAYGITGKSYSWTYTAYSGSKTVTTERYHADGTLDYASYTLTNGATEIKKFTTDGVITSDIITAVDGSSESRTYSNGVLTRVTIVNATANSAGIVKQMYDLTVSGSTTIVKLSSYDAAGKLVSQTYPTSVTDADFALSPVLGTAAGHPIAPVVPVSTAADKAWFLAQNDAGEALAAVDGNESRDMTLSNVALIETAAKTGTSDPNAVTVPGKLIVDVPTISLAGSAAAGDHANTVSVSGIGQAGGSVTLYDGTVAVAAATVNNDGTFTVSPVLGEGVHSLFAVLANGSAQASSDAIVVAVVDAANLAAQAASLLAQGDLAAIYLTGSQTIVIPAGTDVASFVLADAALLAKISGSYSFVQTVTSGNTTATTFYDATGHATTIDTDVMQGGKLVQHIHQDLTAATGATAKEVISYGASNGYARTEQGFDAANQMLWERDSYGNGALARDWVAHSDGSHIAHIYAVDGSLIETIETSAAGLVTMTGGNADNTYIVTSATDRVVEAANGGNDIIHTTLLNYTLGDNIERLSFDGHGDATLTGNALSNVITGGDGNDLLDGGMGNDALYGGPGNDTLNGGKGADLLVGGLGDDGYIVDNVDDVIVEDVDAGTDTVLSYVSYTLSANVEHLTLASSAGAINGTGNALDNRITGNAMANIIDGGAGDDILVGNGGDDVLIGGAGDDLLMGGDGDDVLIGGAGQDKMYGGAGADRFVFYAGDTSRKGATADWITDFSHAQGDKIDLSAIDANSTVAGVQSFTFFDQKPVDPTAGSLWLVHSGSNWQVHGDFNGDGVSDFVLRVDTPNSTVLGASDFILHH